jgi:predicted RND superfamily exporter protein
VSFPDRLAQLALVRGRAVLAAAVLLTLAFGVGYARLTWTDDPEVLELQGSDELDFYREFVGRWGSDELIVLGWEVPDAFAPSELARLRELTDALLDIEGVAWVSSLDTAFTIDTGPFGPYARPLVPDDPADADGVRTAALGSPFARGLLVSPDGRMLLAAVRLDAPRTGDRAHQRAVLERLDRVLARPEFSALHVQLAGSPVFNRALAQLNRRDSALFTPLALGIIALALLALFRSALPAVLALGVLGTSVIWTLGAMGWLGVPLNITTSLLPPLLMVIAVADDVHVLSSYVDELGAGHGRADALRGMLREVAPACVWTSLTTALGFASLLSVRIPSVRSFAAFAVVGVLLALLHALVLLPALLVRTPLERAARRRPPLRGLGALSRAARHPALALGLVGLSAAGAIYAVPRIEVATHDGEFFRASHPINRAYRLLEARLGGVTPFELELAPPPGTPLRSAQTVRAVRALQRELAGVPELTAGTSIADLLLAATPDLDLQDPASVERSLFLAEALAPEEVRGFLHDEPPRARISARALAMTSARSSELLALVRERAAAVLPPGWSARATGLVPVFSQMEQYLVQGQLSSYGLAVASVFAVFAIGFRSLRLAAIALLVNTVPLALGALLMALAGIRLDVATVMVASIALGIIDDDTVHLITVWRAAVQRTGDPRAALQHAFDVAGRAIAVTSLILVAGFAALTFSGFQPTAHFGLLVCAAVATAVLADLLILPAALLRLGGAARFRSSNAVQIP